MNFILQLWEAVSGRITPSSSSTLSVTQIRHEQRSFNAHVRNRMLTLKQPEFFGSAYISLNKRWIVGCNDSNGMGTGGFREHGNGRVILVDMEVDKALHELTSFARPTKAAVSDIGNYIVEDTGFGSSLSGNVVAIDIQGRERYRRSYAANVLNIGLSQCGRYAAVQTANAPSTDGNLLEILDIDRRCIVFSRPPVSGWADSYSFEITHDGRLHAVKVKHKELGDFSYSASGEFLDIQKYQEAQLENGNYAIKLMAARDLLKFEPSQGNAVKALSAANAALEEGAKDVHDWGAIAHRLRGESYELLGQLPEALAAFDHALLLNPKVGIQKRATALRKKLMPA
ncbi:hypothetical protein [Comamonas aquatica]|uniref:Tetratricopeptide repeat protein n=1 Tax=Comamonas aquatica TaxID=225991 RepID=A0AA42L3A2_9BURK|nr:hypothetical protein [Comamonas aquatica]MDH0363365.1 hypothetical protein [Comamonas aquatica]